VTSNHCERSCGSAAAEEAAGVGPTKSSIRSAVMSTTANTAITRDAVSSLASATR
jgi:hypothetical protein